MTNGIVFHKLICTYNVENRQTTKNTKNKLRVTLQKKRRPHLK